MADSSTMSTDTNHSEFDRELLSAYVDGELSGAERAAVEARLASDPAAQRQVEEFRRLSSLIQNLPQPALPADFSAKVLRRAEQARTLSASEPVRPGFSIGRTWRSWAWPGLALAAALLVAVMLPNREAELADRGAATSPRAVKKLPELHASGESSSVASSAPQGGSDLLRDELAMAPQAADGRLSAPESLVADALPPSDAAFDSGAEEPRLLIVRVSMPAGALKRRTLDHVLAQNGIDVEPAADERAESREEEIPEQARELAPRQRAARSGVGELAAGEGGEAAKAEGALGRFDVAEPAEVVLVDAPLEQIAASLASIAGDAENFHAVEIEETSPLLKRELPLVNEKPEQWRQYNRAAIADREPVARDSAIDKSASAADAVATDGLSAARPLATSSPEADVSPQLAEGRRAPPATAEGEPTVAATEAAPSGGVAEPQELKVRERLMERGKAYRYLSDDGKKLGIDALARQQSGLADKEKVAPRVGGGGFGVADSRLRVLFVLEEAPPAAAAPAAIKAAEPTKPPR